MSISALDGRQLSAKLPPETLRNEFKHNLLPSPSANVGRSNTRYNDLSDGSVITEVGAEMLVPTLNERDRTAPDDQDIRSFIRGIREATRHEVPVARLRHQIQEHQRSVTHAVTNAFVERRDQEEKDGGCAYSGVETPTEACMEELKDSLRALLDIVESEKKDAREVVVCSASFVNAVASATAWYLTESNEDKGFTPDSGIANAVTTCPRDMEGLTLAFLRMSACKEHLPLTPKSTYQLSSELIEAVLEGSLSKVCALIESMIHQFACSFNSSFTESIGGSILPFSSCRKATLSPEIVRWAQGLVPMTKGGDLHK